MCPGPQGSWRIYESRSENVSRETFSLKETALKCILYQSRLKHRLFSSSKLSVPKKANREILSKFRQKQRYKYALKEYFIVIFPKVSNTLPPPFLSLLLLQSEGKFPLVLVPRKDLCMLQPPLLGYLAFSTLIFCIPVLSFYFPSYIHKKALPKTICVLLCLCFKHTSYQTIS